MESQTQSMRLTDSQSFPKEFQTLWFDDHFLRFASLDMPGINCAKTVRRFVRFQHSPNLFDVGLRHVKCESSAHVEIAIGFTVIDRYVLLQEAKNRRLFWQMVNHIGKRLCCAHEFAPAMPSDIYSIMNVHSGVEAVLNN